MAWRHIFKANLAWKASSDSESTPVKHYSKSHRIAIVGKEELLISAAKAFKGDPALFNPEDLFLSSLASCHMMSYLYCCAQHHISVLSYEDQAEGILETFADGSGKFTAVHLFPHVVIADSSQVEQALALHQEANKLCFIANSCNFPVFHQPTCSAINP